ncbi:MAG: radical SAM protein [Kofleriaceae bacterium]|nr:radical SAM protein [Kofleriaceae bacterium]
MEQDKAKEIIDRNGRRHRFPPALNLDYVLKEGRVQTRSLEAHIVDHCNLSCAECCSLSPLLPKWFASPEELQRDLAIASSFLAPTVFKLVGGEPLLHPQIATMAKIAAESAIAPRISLTTNGLMLGQMEDDLWRYLDAITISLYPKPELPESLIAQAEEQAAHFSVELNWKDQSQFVVMNRNSRRADESETSAIFNRCWLRERCHMIRNGTFYTCTRSPHMQTLGGSDGSFSEDGYSLTSPEASADGMLTYLRREHALEACAYCHGGDAKMAPHRLLPRSELRQLKGRSALRRDGIARPVVRKA